MTLMTMTVIAMGNYEKCDQTDDITIRLVANVTGLDDTDDDDSDCDEKL